MNGLGLILLITPALIATGALVDKKNRWRGAFLGYAGGALVTTAVTGWATAAALAAEEQQAQLEGASHGLVR